MCCSLVSCLGRANAADQPQWGQAWKRNLVSSERPLPAAFDPKTGRNIKWTAKIGNETHGSPIIAAGRVYIGTNNGEPRDPRHEGDRGVLMCFDEQTGRFLWQLVVPKREEDIFFDWPNSGICSPATVEGDRVYVISNRGEVMCLDPHGLGNGNDGPFKDEAAHKRRVKSESELPLEAIDADIIWLFDLTSGAGIWSHDAAFSSILIDGQYLYLNSGTGVDNTHRKIRTPDAPSLVVLDKSTGRLIARDQERIAPNIFHNTYSSPSLAEINGRRLIFFVGGNGIVYAFEPLPQPKPNAPPAEVATLKKVWQFDFDPGAPKEDVHKYNGNRRESPSNIYGMPVLFENRIYVAGGGDFWWGKNEAWLKCINPVGAGGDITTNGLAWSYTLNKHVFATPSAAEGLVFIPDTARTFHCVDAATGKAVWTHEIKGECWSSPFIADAKVYLGTRTGAFYVFALSREKKLLEQIELGSSVSATPTAANGVLYVATMSHLYAVQEKR
jgi:outer membrane protein assembly factor BamB